MSWSPYRAMFACPCSAPLERAAVPKLVFVRRVHDLTMLPFLVTAAVLVITSVRMSKERVQPKGCGVNYDREER